MLLKCLKAAIAIIIASGVLSQKVLAQSGAGNERASMYQLLKPLPPGFHHFVQVAPDLRVDQASEHVGVLCRDMRAAIAFGSRRARGLSAHAAVRAISQVSGGAIPCGHAATGLRLTPLAFAT